jgi:hypothetical protein
MLLPQEALDSSLPKRLNWRQTPWRLPEPRHATPRHATPRGELGCRDGSQSLNRSFDSRHHPSPVIGVTKQSLGAPSDRLSGAPFDNSRLAIVY